MIDLGEKVTRMVEVSDLNSTTGRFSARREMRTGTVVYVHPQRRYYEVEFKISTGGAWRETFHF